MKKIAFIAAAAAASLSIGVGTASAAHQHVENPSGCHDTASRAGRNNPESNWNKNVNNQANGNGTVSTGTCASLTP